MKRLNQLLLNPVVFLRTLDYYSGILFLTTNRVRSFERAVINRMALVVHFDRLGETARAKIRGNCIKKLCEDKRFTMTEEVKDEVAELDKDPYDWSGREINSGGARFVHSKHSSYCHFMAKHTFSVFGNACDFALWERGRLNPGNDPRSGPIDISDIHIKEAVEVIHK